LPSKSRARPSYRSGIRLGLRGSRRRLLEEIRSNKEPSWIEKSRAACQQASRLDSKLSSAHACLGTLSAGTGNYQRQRENSNGPLRPSLPTMMHFAVCRSMRAFRQTRRGRKYVPPGDELRPHYWAGYNWLGAFYYRHVRFREAAEMFNQVVALAPDSFLGYSNLGATHVEQARYADAIKILEKSIAIRPSDYGYTNLGNAYFFLRRYEEADQAYQQAIKLSEKDSLLWWNLGDGYYWTPGKTQPISGCISARYHHCGGRAPCQSRNSYSYGVLAICHAMLGEKKLALDALGAGSSSRRPIRSCSFKPRWFTISSVSRMRLSLG